MNEKVVSGKTAEFTPYEKIKLNTHRTCTANVGPSDYEYEACGANLRALKDGTYKCKIHDIMLV